MKKKFWGMSFISMVLLIGILSFASSVLAQDASNCPSGQGYWKNTATWPLTELTLGSQVYSQAELLILFNTSVGGDASIQLAHQLIAAALNVSNGGDATIASGLIVQANTLLSAYVGKLPYTIDASSTDGQAMVNIANVLESYNSGQLTVNCTVTVTETPEATEAPEATDTPEATEVAEATETPDGTGGTKITIVIEGPVEKINVNIITIYNINIELSQDDPNLSIIQVGDIVRIEGDTDTMNGTIVIIAVTVVIINVDVNIDTGEVFRDQGNCNNPPPDWAPANGWRRRCGDININIDINTGGEDDGMGMGMGKKDKDKGGK